MSSGENIEGRAGKAVRWTIQCTGMKGLIPNCFASVLAVDPDQQTARSTAISRWNRRVQNATSSQSAAGDTPKLNPRTHHYENTH